MSEGDRKRLAIRGYDSQNGARPLARLRQEEVKKPLSDELLFGRLAKGGRVTVGVKAGTFTFDFEILSNDAGVTLAACDALVNR